MKKLSEYRHKQSGELYLLHDIGNLNTDKEGWEPQAIYEDEQYRLWVRPWKEFREKFELVGEVK